MDKMTLDVSKVLRNEAGLVFNLLGYGPMTVYGLINLCLTPDLAHDEAREILKLLFESRNGQVVLTESQFAFIRNSLEILADLKDSLLTEMLDAEMGKV